MSLVQNNETSTVHCKKRKKNSHTALKHKKLPQLPLFLTIFTKVPENHSFLAHFCTAVEPENRKGGPNHKYNIISIL